MMKNLKKGISVLTAFSSFVVMSLVTLTGCTIDLSKNPSTEIDVKKALNSVYNNTYGYVETDEEILGSINTPMSFTHMEKSNKIIAYAQTEEDKENVSLNEFSDILQSAETSTVEDILAFDDGEISMYLEMAAYFSSHPNMPKNEWNRGDVSEFWGGRKMLIRINYDDKYIYVDFVVDDREQDVAVHMQLDYDFLSGDFYFVVFYGNTTDVRDKGATMEDYRKRYELTYKNGQVQTFSYIMYNEDNLSWTGADRSAGKAFNQNLPEKYVQKGKELLAEGWTKKDWAAFVSGIDKIVDSEYMKNYIVASASRFEYKINCIGNAKENKERLLTLAEQLPESTFRTYILENKDKLLIKINAYIADVYVRYISWQKLTPEELTGQEKSQVQIALQQLDNEIYCNNCVTIKTDYGDGYVDFPTSMASFFFSWTEEGEPSYSQVNDVSGLYWDEECTQPLTENDVLSFDLTQTYVLYQKAE